MSARRRLHPDARRGELLEVAARLFADRSYDAVRMDDVAREAGVSRALLYQYFPAKRDLFAGVYRDAADRLLAVTEVSPDRSLVEQVAAGLDAHLDYFTANATTVLTANRTLAGDPVIAAIIDEELDVLRSRLLDASALTGPTRDLVSSVLAGWLVLVRVLCVDWLADPTTSRDAVRDVCTGALVGALAAVPGLDLAALG